MDECGGAYGLMLRCLSLLSNALRSQFSSRLQSMAKKSKASLQQPEAGPSRRDVTPDEDEEVDDRFTQQFSDDGQADEKNSGSDGADHEDAWDEELGEGMLAEGYAGPSQKNRQTFNT